MLAKNAISRYRHFFVVPGKLQKMGRATLMLFVLLGTLLASGVITSVQAAHPTVSNQNSGQQPFSALDTTPTPQPTALPSPWQDQDIGSVSQAGSASYTNGTFTIKGSGADIWGTSDAFNYVYQPLVGDGTIVARVVSVQNTNSWAKTGVMIRETLTANATFADMVVTPGSGTAFQRRTSTGASAAHTAGPHATAPEWVKLTRSGNTFTGYASTDGTTWTQVGTDTIAMANQAYIGLPVTAHNNSALNTSTLDSVTVTSTAPGTASVASTPTPPTIDGNGNDAIWSSATSYTLTHVVGSPSGFSSSFQSAWDTANLYFLVKVQDASYSSHADMVEIYIDPTHDGGTSYDSLDMQYQFPSNSTTVAQWNGGHQGTNTAGIVFANLAVSGGYQAEIEIPWTLLGVTPSANMTFGLDLDAWQNPANGLKDKLFWNATSDSDWTNPSLFGTATLQGTAAPASNWPTYLQNNDHSGINANETILTAANFANLTVKWTAQGVDGISNQPIEANNIVYWGSWDGNMHATTTDGKALWSTPLGNTTGSKCDPPLAGIIGTPTISTIGSTPVLFTPGGNANFYALNANTGQILWSQDFGAAPPNFIWGSPALYNGSVYIGVASFADCPTLAQGRIYKVDAATGTIQGTFDIEPNGCLGAGLWGSPTIDTATGLIYFATGNGSWLPCPSGEPYAVAVVAIRASDLSVANSWQIPASEQSPDGDFGSTPTLFSATINGTLRQLVGVSNKNGIFYTFDRSNLAAGPLWRATIAEPGDSPQNSGAAISPAAWDGSTLYVGGGTTTINGTTCKGSVRALDPATGNVKWQDCTTSGPVLGALSGIPGVVVATQGAEIDAFDMATGKIIFTYTDTTSKAVFYGPVSIANGQMFVGNLDGNFFAFGL